VIKPEAAQSFGILQFLAGIDDEPSNRIFILRPAMLSNKAAVLAPLPFRKDNVKILVSGISVDTIKN